MYSSVWIQHLEEAFTATLILPIKVVVNDLCEDRQKKGPIISPNQSPQIVYKKTYEVNLGAHQNLTEIHCLLKYDNCKYLLCLKRSFFKWANPGLFFVYFRSFQTNNTNFTINVKKCPSSIQSWDSNPRPYAPESSPITTRPGPPTSFYFYLQENAATIATLDMLFAETRKCRKQVWRLFCLQRFFQFFINKSRLIPASFCLFQFLSNTKFTEKTVDFSRI